MHDVDKVAPFETFLAEDGRILHGVGLLQIWQRGYVEKSDRWKDPAPFIERLTYWLTENHSTIIDLGLIHFCFPDVETAERFRIEWHEPGEQKKIAYYASDEHRALKEKNARVIEEWRATRPQAS